MRDGSDDLVRLGAVAGAVAGVGAAAGILRHRLREHAPPPPVGRAPSVAPPPVTPAPVEADTDGDVRPPALVEGAPLTPPPDYPRTLAAALRHAASVAPDRGVVYVAGDDTADRQTYRELCAEAEALVGRLRAAGLRRGDPVLFQFDDNREFVTAFWACVFGGFLPTPVGTAPSYGAENATTRKLHAAWRLLGEPPVLTEPRLESEVARLAELWGTDALRVCSRASLPMTTDGPEPAPEPRPGDLVLNLLTSGSTGVPKCVRHTNDAIALRSYAAIVTHAFGPAEVSLNWMPLDHVGGLVMYHVRDVFLVADQVLARMDAFVADPLRWLDWTDRFRATVTWAPNFAFALVNEQADRIEAGRWDLSSMRVIVNGGEAVVAATAHRFLRLLAPHGLPDDAMVPSWGMSETSSGVACGRLRGTDDSVGTAVVDARTLGGDLRFRRRPGPGGVAFVEVGGPMPGVSMRIVGPDGAVVPEGRIGRLHVRGPMVFTGYHANPTANAESFTADGWFDTGDLAFLRAGVLTLTGREKDLIIVNGANYLAYDLESVVERVPGVAVTWVAACAVTDPGHGTDRVAIFFVAEGTGDPADTVAAIRTALGREVGLRPDFVVPVTKAEFPRTANGKIARGQLVTALLDGAFADRLAPPPSDGAHFFEPVWQPDTTPTGAPPVGRYLLLAPPGSGDLTHRLRPALPAGSVLDVAVVGRAPGGQGYGYDPTDPADCARLLDDVLADGPAPVAVVHAHAFPSWPAARNATDIERGLRLGVCSVAGWVRALADRGLTGSRLLVVTSGAAWTGPRDRVDLRKAAITGLVRSAAAERAIDRVWQLDVPPDPSAAAKAIVAELAGRDREAFVASRDGTRSVPRLRVAGPMTDPGGDGIVAGGRYLITGGLGGVGFEVAQQLLAGYGASLLVVGRSALAGTAAGRFAELGELGDVTYARVDVADAPGLAAAVDAFEQGRGGLSGVLHLAHADASGYWDDLDSHTVTRESVDEYLRMLHPKAAGAWALGRLLMTRPDTVLVLFSSVNGFFGGVSFGAYAAASSAVDGFATNWAFGAGRPVRCVAWTMWTDAGVWARAGAGRADRAAAAGRSRGFEPVDTSRGLTALHAALGQPRPLLLAGLDAANPHVQRMLADDQLGAAEPVVAVTPADPAAPPPDLADRVTAALRAAGVTADVVVLPDLPVGGDGRVDETRLRELVSTGGRTFSPFAEPATPLERDIAAIWSDVLDVRRVGHDDSFFALGGDSMRAMKVMARVNAMLDTNHPVRLLYENPTLDALAEVVTR